MELTFNDEHTFNTSSSAMVPSYNNNSFTNPLELNQYSFVSQCYHGDGGILNGNLLVPYDREMWYQKRKVLSSYRNFLKPIVDSICTPVFNAPIVRTTTNDLFQTFLNDVDNKGTDINEFSNDVVLYSRLHGVCFVVMDNFEALPSTLNEQINQRVLPYAYIQDAGTVKSYQADMFDKLISITFYGPDKVINDNTYHTDITWDSNKVVRRVLDGDKVIDSKTKIHNLNMLPIISVYSTFRDKVLPQPPFYDIAKLNCNLYNKDSELRDQERAQAFSVFYCQTDTNNNNIAIGPHAGIILPLDERLNITPGYASPDSSILKVLQDSSMEFVNSIFKAADIQGINVIKQSSSGIAEAYRFISTNNQLKKSALISQRFELKLSKVFSRYINQEVDYECVYTTSYDNFYGKTSVDDMLKLLSADLPVAVKNEIKKNLIVKTLDNLDYNKINELKDIVDTGVMPDTTDSN